MSPDTLTVVTEVTRVVETSTTMSLGWWMAYIVMSLIGMIALGWGMHHLSIVLSDAEQPSVRMPAFTMVVLNLVNGIAFISFVMLMILFMTCAAGAMSVL